MRVIGTAGHVDHGKSALVRAITNIEPDRLREEKQRGLTIDLGFAWYPLSNGETLGLVDVPGHQDFIENMLAGISGIDLILLVVAADEGIMPQTREHVSIASLLGIEQVIVALSKVDLIHDADWLELIKDDIRTFLASLDLQASAIIEVSSHTGAGIPQLKETLETTLKALPFQTNYHHPRLPIDRAFSVSGFGTVVTGTLTGGTLKPGDQIQIQPSGKIARIRGLQSYQQEIEVALPGSRVAVNLSGIDGDEIQRGDVFCSIGMLENTQLIDAYVKVLKDASRPLKHQMEVKFFSGSSETMAKIRVLGSDQILAGQEGWIQIQLDKALALAAKDRFILRVPSPSETLGGGQILHAKPLHKWRVSDQKVIESFETLLFGSQHELVLQLSDADKPVSYQQIQQVSGLEDAALKETLAFLLASGELFEIDNAYWSQKRFGNMAKKLVGVLETYHQTFPLKKGMRREGLRTKLGLPLSLFNALINGIPQIIAEADLLSLNSHQIQLTAAQRQLIDQALNLFVQNPFSPPAVKELKAVIGDDLYFMLLEDGQLVLVQEDVVFHSQDYEKLSDWVIQEIERAGQLDTKEVRDHFATSRKYAIGLLEHLDQIGITRRDGDYRVKGPRFPQ
ncbi:selenocysteine-specific translation elongation factor [Anaerolineales bacterium]